MPTVAINGLGRIGRAALKILVEVRWDRGARAHPGGVGR
jgi:glyceraldehyde-3-phosphate dehydrogenase/erythrose-4-phosphate dehydrogenase